MFYFGSADQKPVKDPQSAASRHRPTSSFPMFCGIAFERFGISSWRETLGMRRLSKDYCYHGQDEPPGLWAAKVAEKLEEQSGAEKGNFFLVKIIGDWDNSLIRQANQSQLTLLASR